MPSTQRWTEYEETWFGDAVCERFATDRWGEQWCAAALWTHRTDAALRADLDRVLLGPNVADLHGDHDLAIVHRADHSLVLILAPHTDDFQHAPLVAVYRAEPLLGLKPAHTEEALSEEPILLRAWHRWERRHRLSWDAVPEYLPQVPIPSGLPEWQEQRRRWREQGTPYGGSWRCEDRGAVADLVAQVEEYVSDWQLQPATHGMTAADRLAAPPLTPVTAEEVLSRLIDVDSGQLRMRLESWFKHDWYGEAQRQGAQMDCFTKQIRRPLIDCLVTTAATQTAMARGTRIIHVTPALPRPEGMSIEEWVRLYGWATEKMLHRGNGRLHTIQQSEGLRLHVIRFNSDEPTAGRDGEGWWTPHWLLVPDTDLSDEQAERVMERIEQSWEQMITRRLRKLGYAIDAEDLDYKLCDARWWRDSETGAPYPDTQYFYKAVSVHERSTPTIHELRMRRRRVSAEIKSHHRVGSEVPASVWRELARIDHSIDALAEIKRLIPRSELPSELVWIKKLLNSDLGETLVDTLQAAARQNLAVPASEVPEHLYGEAAGEGIEEIAVQLAEEPVAVGQGAVTPSGSRADEHRAPREGLRVVPGGVPSGAGVDGQVRGHRGARWTPSGMQGDVGQGETRYKTTLDGYERTDSADRGGAATSGSVAPVADPSVHGGSAPIRRRAVCCQEIRDCRADPKTRRGSVGICPNNENAAAELLLHEAGLLDADETGPAYLHPRSRCQAKSAAWSMTACASAIVCRIEGPCTLNRCSRSAGMTKLHPAWATNGWRVRPSVSEVARQTTGSADQGCSSAWPRQLAAVGMPTALSA